MPAGLFRLFGVLDVLLSLPGALSFPLLRLALLFLAHVFPGLFGEIAGGLILAARLGRTLLSLPLLFGPLLKALLLFILLALVAAAPPLVLLGE